ncbi:MAG: hypothetical protein K8J08_19530, partial [Thermoanaerobaculia bacterium]|nr:hypothetical protein [Thermoanaerobaculia bacterium]
ALHDVELDGTGESRLTPHGIDASRILRRRQFQWAPWAAGVVVLAALVLAGWTYFLKSHGAGVVDSDSILLDAGENGEGNSANQDPGTTNSEEALGSNGLSADGTAPGSESTGGPGVPVGPEGGDVAVLDGSGNDATSGAEGAGAEGEETDPPAAILPAHLHIPAAWSPSMSVAIGNKTYTLDGARDLELSPGTYTLNYRLQLEGYSDSARQTVNLASEEKVTVRVPIQRPGLIDVQPRLSSPQKGYVYLGRELLGPSPVRGRQIKPGTYTLRVVPDLGDDQVSIETPVTLTAGGKLIVTFDLGSGDMILRDASD